MIIDALIERIRDTGNPTVVGLDPRPEIIPSYILDDAFRACTDPLEAVSNAVLAFNRSLIDALYDIVPAVKPQIAFYEQYGASGVACYRETVRYAKAKGLLVIGDIKRGDIASTAQAYADAHMGRVNVNGQALCVLETDFVTVNPYLGCDAVLPFVENARRYDKGLFVLVKTSNKGAGDIQDLETPQGRLFEVVGDKVSEWGRDLTGKYGYSSVGAVVGATHPGQASALRKRMPHVFFLVPGYGAQGGTAADVRPCFNEDGKGAIVNNSRGIIAAFQQPEYQSRFSAEQFALAAKEAAVKMRGELRSCLNG